MKNKVKLRLKFNFIIDFSLHFQCHIVNVAKNYVDDVNWSWQQRATLHKEAIDLVENCRTM